MIKHEINAEMCAEYRESVITAANAALNFEKIEYSCEINIEITDNAAIRQLNKEFRGEDKITDVLSFPMIEPGVIEPGGEFAEEINPENGAVMLGDIVISGERAKEQSGEINQSFERELMFLTVHSVLHLLGYDHELSEKDDLIMRKKQREIMELL